MGHTTVAAPAPMPDTNLPNAIVKTEYDVACVAEPIARAQVNAIMASKRPYRVAMGPAASEPESPPMVKMDWTKAH